MIRQDVPYIRRRVKKGNEPVQEESATSLKLNNSPIKKSRLPPFREVEDKTILTLDEPTVRLNPYQSAIGSLVIREAKVFAWETNNGYGNIVHWAQDSTAPMYGNRPLAEFHKGDIVMGLRHSKHLRRLIVGQAQGYLRATLYDGSEIVADGNNGKNVLIISRIGNQAEIRLENINGDDIIQTFGIQVMP